MSNGAGVDCGCEIVWRVRVAERRLAGCCCCSRSVYIKFALSRWLAPRAAESIGPSSQPPRHPIESTQAGCTGPSHSAATERVHGSKFTTYTRRTSERALSAAALHQSLVCCTHSILCAYCTALRACDYSSVQSAMHPHPRHI